MNRVISFIRSLVTLPDTEAQKFAGILQQKRISKGHCFIREGQTPRKFAFVEEGLFRYYYIDNNGTEFTKNFITGGNFIVAYSAMIGEKPSPMFIEAMEDSLIYEIYYPDWQALRKSHPCWNELLVCLLEKAFMIKEKRERELLLLGAEERYRIFLQEHPGLEKRIKQHFIASYLGISPVSLSRIRKSAALT